MGNCGIPIIKPTTETTVASDYQIIISRYVGLHSTVPYKTARESFCNSLSALGLARRSTEVALESQVEGIEDDDEDASNKTIKSAIANDPLMKIIKNAKENAAYRKKVPKGKSKNFSRKY